jgi:serine protease AprX
MAGYKPYFLIFGFAMILAFGVNAQDRYAIHYKYKPQDLYTLENPNEFLTEASIARRLKQGIGLDSLDLPVSPKYIDLIQPLVQSVYYHSHWLNASVVVAHREEVDVIQTLDFVDTVLYIARGFVEDTSSSNRTNGKAGLKANSKKKSASSEAPFDYQNNLLGIEEMHQFGFKGTGVTIAVFDAGFPGVDQIEALSHIFENGQFKGGRDFVHVWNRNIFSKNQHGTSVLSLIAANDPEVLLSGAPEANYILCITEEVPTEYRVEEYNWIKAAEYADSLGVDIINSSLGYWDFDDPVMNYNLDDMDGETALISRGASIAANKGILVVTSAGNYGNRGVSSLTAPGDAKGILSVGATNMGMERASFSSQGPTADGRIKPDVSTFGEQVWLLRSNGTMGRSNGTSFSAPQIAALAAGLWEANPNWTKDELIEKILLSSTQAENPDNLIGYGIPNFSGAHLGEILHVVQKEEENWKIYPNPLEGNSLFVQLGSKIDGEFMLMDSQGRTIQKSAMLRNNEREPFLVSLPDMPSGFYVVEIQSGKVIKRTKLMKW